MANSYKPLRLLDGKFSEKKNHQNFSYNLIDEDLLVPDGQEMPLSREFKVVSGFGLKVDGKVIVQGQVDEIIIPPADPENFSYFEVGNAITKEVPLFQEMCVSTSIKVSGSGAIKVSGRMSVVTKVVTLPEKRVPKVILSGESFTIPLREEYFFKGWISVNGSLTNNGFLSVG